MKSLFSKGLVMFAGMISAPVAITHVVEPSPSAEYRDDPRLESLESFFEEGDCPAQSLSAEFLRAADRNHLDWRLLPSLSVIESGGGRQARNNNLFGWDGGRAEYPSARAGIYDVAFRLGNSKLYRNKGLDQMLRTYNQNANYAGIVKSVMQRISESSE